LASGALVVPGGAEWWGAVVQGGVGVIHCR